MHVTNNSGSQDPLYFLNHADLIHDQHAVESALDRLAVEITHRIGEVTPIVMCVMGGAVVFAGQLLPKLKFPLVFDYVQASRYQNQMVGQAVIWKVEPSASLQGRVVLLLDDILDEGHTLAAVRQKCLAQGAAEVVIAVMVEKTLGHAKPIQADFVGLTVPNRYVFGYGMDVYDWWRNLPAIYALK